MVKQFSEKIARRLANNRVIQEKDTGIYQYGLSILVYSFSNIVTILIIGGILGCIPEGICYTVCYIILRKFTGGYHARTPHACYLISSSMYFVSIYVVRSGLVNESLLVSVAILAVICSFIVPVDTENKVLSKREKKVYRLISLSVFLLEVSMGIVAYRYHFRMLYDSVIVAVFCCELLAITGYVYNRWNDKREPKPESP